jgi:hypothetical protein
MQHISTIVEACLLVQVAVLALLAQKLRWKAPGALGFLFMVTTFIYHGLTEIVQAIFPDRNVYRSLVGDEPRNFWMVVITAAMVSFTACYLYWHSKRTCRTLLQDLRRELAMAYFTKWPVMLALGLGGLVLTLVRKNTDQSSYWAGGLADQFTTLALSISIAGLSLNTNRRNIVLLFTGFFILMASSGSRNEIITVILVAAAALYRYGIKIRMRLALPLALVGLLVLFSISLGRSQYGRFNNGENLIQRLDIIASSVQQPINGEDILNDTVYRFDGNTFGAMVLERQQWQNYGLTGFREAWSTISYVIPSFINRSKLSTEVYERNEEAYQDNFFVFNDEIDYISDFWSLLIGYAGWVGTILIAGILGLICTWIDNWLAQTPTQIAYLTGITLSAIPANLELGIAGIPYTIRGMLLLLAVAELLKWGRRRRRIHPFAPVDRPAVVTTVE